jgi:hypothetical protein
MLMVLLIDCRSTHSSGFCHVVAPYALTHQGELLGSRARVEM